MKKVNHCFGLLLILFLAVTLPAVASAGWTTEAVDAPKYFTAFYQRAIAIDRSNQPHIAYGGETLYYAYFDGIEWQYEVIDNSPGVGTYASIAIDSNNNVHISYYDSTNRALKYATGGVISPPPTNNPPSAPELVYPEDAQTGLGTTVEFRWKKSTDLDGDIVTYDLYVCEEDPIVSCAPVEQDIAASLEDKGNYYAGIGVYGVGLLLYNQT